MANKTDFGCLLFGYCLGAIAWLMGTLVVVWCVVKVALWAWES